MNSGLALYKVSSFLMVIFLLIVNFRSSRYYARIVQVFKLLFFQLVTALFLGLIICALYVKHSVRFSYIIYFLGSGYVTIAFSSSVLILFLFLYRNHKELIIGFLSKYIPVILSLAGMIGILGGIKFLLSVFNLNILDIFLFGLPFYEYFTFGSVILLLGIAIMRRQIQNIVVQSYFYLFINFVLFLFICWVSVNAIYSFDLAHQLVRRYLAEARVLSVDLMIILYCLFVFNLVTILFLGFVLVSRIVKTIIEIISRHLQGLYQNYIINWIFEDPNSSVAINNFRRLNRSVRQSRYRRNLIVKELVSLQRNLSGDIVLKAKDLFYELKLTKDLERALRYGRWPEKIKAVQVAAFFEYTVAIPLIQKFITSRNDVLRMEAQIALIKLNHSSEALSFLQFYPYLLSEYSYIHIMKAIGDEAQDMNVVPLFESTNDTVVIFALKMSGLFGLVANYERIIELLRHGSPQIREAAIFSLGQLSLPQSAGPLMDFYQIETYRNKIHILEVIQRIPVETSIAWLINLIKEERDYSLRLSALKALQNTNLAGENIIENSFSEADEELSSLIRHVNDKRI